jgi:hypothetical protein
MRAAWERDAAVERVSFLTRIAVAGSIALSLAFTALVAWAHPGRAKSATGTASIRSTPVSSPPTTSASNGSDDAPATLPSSTAAPTTVAPVTVPQSAYTPQPYVGNGGGGIVSGQT